MKLLISLVCTALVMGPVVGQERVPLWPRSAQGAREGSPSIQVYPTKGAEGHSGAAVVICPGGGYGSLAKDHEGHQPAHWFNEQGVSAFVLHYRLGSQGHHYPAQLADVQRAIRWVRSCAEQYQLDPQRIAVMGFSAGGHLASMAATLFEEKAYDSSDEVDQVSARPDFAILCYPVISLDSAVTHSGSRKNLLGPERAADDAFARKLSSELNVTERTPPTFLFQTDEDTAVPAENAIRFYLALRAKKIPAELHSYQRGPHGVGLYLGDPILGTWSKHLSDWLRTNAFFSPAQPRAALSGEVLLDGKPVSWGSLAFHPQDQRFPVTTLRVRNGKFSVKKAEGPIIGSTRVTFEGSIWEATGANQDRAVRLESMSPQDPAPVIVKVESDLPPLRLEYTSR